MIYIYKTVICAIQFFFSMFFKGSTISLSLKNNFSYSIFEKNQFLNYIENITLSYHKF